jgi:hypothetical protein
LSLHRGWDAGVTDGRKEGRKEGEKMASPSSSRSFWEAVRIDAVRRLVKSFETIPICDAAGKKTKKTELGSKIRRKHQRK